MIENYTRLSSRIFTATVVGKDQKGRKITEGVETYKTPSGVYEIKDWARHVEKAAEADGIRTRSGERCKLILETLGNRSMTVEEITDELVAAGHLKYYDRNFVAPRLTELKGAGVLEVVGKKPSKRTGKNTAVWAAVRR